MFHQSMKALLMDDRKILWGNQQRKIVVLLKTISEKLVHLSVPEIFELMALSAKYIQIGEEFSGISAIE